MLFFVSEPVAQNSRPLPAVFPHVRLTSDRWDDYGYKTTFGVEILISEDEILDLGYVKILDSTKTYGRTLMPALFSSLDQGYCSLGQEFEYYEKLLKAGPAIYIPFLSALRDASFDEQIRAHFEDQEGFRVSLLRTNSARRALSDGGKLFKYKAVEARVKGEGPKFAFKTQVSDEAQPLVIEFDFKQKGGLPNRINAVIGYNGTGKTRLLSNLAIVISGYGYETKQDLMSNRAGRLIGAESLFESAIVVSYSAFDTFEIPGRDDVERSHVNKEGGVFGYVYCGLREHAKSDNDYAGYRLKTSVEIENEFVRAVERIRANAQIDNYIQILKPLILDASFQRVNLGMAPFIDDSEESLRNMFGALSTGHKIVLKIVSQLAAHLNKEKQTLVIIDEPEAHLHPPLLASLLRSVRVCLELFDAYALIATHSPVVLQETPARFVRILRRFGATPKVSSPEIETFGENISVITQEVFNLDDTATDWHNTLKELAASHSVDELDALFGSRLGFAARSYVLSQKDDVTGD